jgi:orotate phosphoribosyltransferase
MLKFVDKLRKSGVIVEDAVIMVNRMQLSDGGKTVEEKFESEGLKLYSLTDAKELLPELLARLELQNPEFAQEMRNRLNREYEREYEEAGRTRPFEL